MMRRRSSSSSSTGESPPHKRQAITTLAVPVPSSPRRSPRLALADITAQVVNQWASRTTPTTAVAPRARVVRRAATAPTTSLLSVSPWWQPQTAQLSLRLPSGDRSECVQMAGDQRAAGRSHWSCNEASIMHSAAGRPSRQPLQILAAFSISTDHSPIRLPYCGCRTVAAVTSLPRVPNCGTACTAEAMDRCLSLDVQPCSRGNQRADRDCYCPCSTEGVGQQRQLRRRPAVGQGRAHSASVGRCD